MGFALKRGADVHLRRLPTVVMMLQAEALLEHLAGAIGAELSYAVCKYELLFGVNTVARAEFTHMQQELDGWGPFVAVRHQLLGHASRPAYSCMQLWGCATFACRWRDMVRRVWR